MASQHESTRSADQAPHTERITLTLGLFTSPEAIDAGLAHMQASGIVQSRFRIVAPDTSLAFDAAHLARLPTGVPVDRVPVDRSRADPVPADFLAWLQERTEEAEGTGRCDPSPTRIRALRPPDALDRVRRRLGAHLMSDGAILLGRAADAADEKAICSILLAHAAGGVLTHQNRCALHANRPATAAVAAHAAA